MATPEGQTKDGFETQFGTNHLGHFLLFKFLESTLLASASPEFCSRVVSLSSSGHKSSPILFDDLDLKKSGYTPFKAYGQSKTANIYLANEVSSFCTHFTHPVGLLCCMNEMVIHDSVITQWRFLTAAIFHLSA